ncbi:MAG: FAD-dependent oxidoreductase [Nanoarchaeota archaeon]|nr:FAD-dependent oxidoreductase [Nanoarchaeota archaeon]
MVGVFYYQGDEMYDLIIIGGGPAGITAAIYAARQKLNFLMVSLDVGGQMVWSSEVENYPGTSFSTGIELVQKFQEHMKKYKIVVKKEEVLSVRRKSGVGSRGSGFIVKTSVGVYDAKAVIIASGKKPKKLGVPGEDEFLGKGVNYCATCDAPLFKGKTVAVIGGGNSGMEGALFLGKYAKRVYLMDINTKLGGEAHLRERVLGEKNIEVLNSINVTSISGIEKVNGIKYAVGSENKELKVDGVFIEIGLVTKADFTDVKKNKWGEIMLFRGTRTHNENLTSVPGIFAAGDCTDIPAKQIVVAAGEGAKAALALFDYIARNK